MRFTRGCSRAAPVACAAPVRRAPVCYGGGDAMKHSLEHLPARKQRQLDTVVKIIRAAVEVEMIILYGSHARGDWVEDTRGHKFSDFDILVIVDTRARAEDIDLWSNIRDRCELLV